MTTQPRNTDPYSDPRAFYGAELRRLREAAGLTQEQLGHRVFCSGSYIGQFEVAIRRPQLELSQLLDDVLDSGEHLQRLCRLARNSKVADYFADAADLEQRARLISEYVPMCVPGFLQTEAYARAVTSAALRFSPQDMVDQFVRARMERARLLDGSDAPVYWAILHESTLRVPVGGPAAMHEQLCHLAETVRSRRNVALQVMPFDAGAHPFMTALVSLMNFADAPPLVYTESAYTGHLVEDPALVAQYQAAYDLARAVALSPEASLALIESAAKDFATHEQRA
ncbi:DNA-binding protein [Streptomyces eurocidicus]|uniref:DNA-binding protein n=1 Tax=Streptomyces eurocidicus TaxID=66423 RepID=A0A2N8NVX2_STREU|nr:helix-turn-helix transcriptional regulator [Streptomyces eurocidicus]MBB5119120.1 transcriptional regulator with XRE-family HTH domain [Streptomyces eurocidicus]MBF6050433.1 helix-turn-helix domain-containing protein [Streptomyces eurocidicus]PNE32925.1 DNA-binding protein [Streptomyces eurocidicus]